MILLHTSYILKYSTIDIFLLKKIFFIKINIGNIITYNILFAFLSRSQIDVSFLSTSRLCFALSHISFSIVKGTQGTFRNESISVSE